MPGLLLIASPKFRKIAFSVFVWAVTAWLIFPLIFMQSVSLQEASKYFYRSAVGIILLIILFGKTVTDLFFPLDTSRRKSLLQFVFLTVYALVMAGGIILMLFRILALYLKSGSAGQVF
ncbi:MAG: hypothetical protein A2V45_11455 [Candidatus Aminicenantes bacterium RBG_19FT_COMBO_58_17]|nr:MAG: hypothetical protein A2V45_11455 [Candidatus Aminicenantes bacterium RBG_19FT_COMBO_58_17]HCS49439.1 hypothetical protein [Candidatus Aminicenantes bacterium]